MVELGFLRRKKVEERARVVGSMGDRLGIAVLSRRRGRLKQGCTCWSRMTEVVWAGCVHS